LAIIVKKIYWGREIFIKVVAILQYQCVLSSPISNQNLNENHVFLKNMSFENGFDEIGINHLKYALFFTMLNFLL